MTGKPNIEQAKRKRNSMERKRGKEGNGSKLREK